MLVVTYNFPQSSGVWFGWFYAKERHSHEQRPRRRRWVLQRRAKCLCAAGSCVITRLNAAPSLSVVLNLQPVAEVCCSPPRPMKEYRLFVIGSVTTECTQQQMRNRKKKCFGGWNVMWTVGFNHWTPQGCYRLPSMLLKAKGSFRPGFAVIRPDGVKRPQFPGTTREGEDLWKWIWAADGQEELFSWTARWYLGQAVWCRKWVQLGCGSFVYLS